LLLASAEKFDVDVRDVSGITASYAIPCTSKGANSPAGCVTSRVRTVKCDSKNTNGYPTVGYNNATVCDKDSAISFKQWFNIQFGDAGGGNCLEITAQMGECWGVNPINGGRYDCQGQCGAGCISGCGLFNGGGSWSKNCFKHDICSWYYGASGGGSDANCGKSYNQASSDLLKCSCTISSPTCNF